MVKNTKALLILAMISSGLTAETAKGMDKPGDFIFGDEVPSTHVRKNRAPLNIAEIAGEILTAGAFEEPFSTVAYFTLEGKLVKIPSKKSNKPTRVNPNDNQDAAPDHFDVINIFDKFYNIFDTPEDDRVYTPEGIQGLLGKNFEVIKDELFIELENLVNKQKKIPPESKPKIEAQKADVDMPFSLQHNPFMMNNMLNDINKALRKNTTIPGVTDTEKFLLLNKQQTEYQGKFDGLLNNYYDVFETPKSKRRYTYAEFIDVLSETVYRHIADKEKIEDLNDRLLCLYLELENYLQDPDVKEKYVKFKLNNFR